MPELLQQGRVLDPLSHSDRTADVLIDAGIVTAISDSIADYPADTQLRDCRGLVLAPGLVDCYSRAGEPGFEERETLASLTQAATAGGFTRVAVLPNTQPPLDNPGAIARFFDILKAQPFPHAPQLLPWAAQTRDIQGQQMTELAELALTGAIGFADGKPIPNLLLVRRILEYLHPLDKPVLLWACNPDLQGNGVMREGSDATVFGLPGIPAIAETAALAALLECVAETGTPVHFMRISTARSVELIRTAKDKGLPVTASTTWMHLLRHTGDLVSYDPSLRLNPPLGTPADQQALRQAVREGILDAIAIDHTPYTYEEKTVAFAEAPNGAIGLELALPLLWQHLVVSHQWTPLELWNALSTRPAQCLQQSPPQIQVGHPAEMILFDPAARWIVDKRSLASLAHNTPWFGQSLQGRILNSWYPWGSDSRSHG